MTPATVIRDAGYIRTVLAALLPFVRDRLIPQAAPQPIMSVSVHNLLSAAAVDGLQQATIIGEREDGSLYFASTLGDFPEALWALEKARAMLLEKGGRL